MSPEAELTDLDQAERAEGSGGADRAIIAESAESAPHHQPPGGDEASFARDVRAVLAEAPAWGPSEWTVFSIPADDEQTRVAESLLTVGDGTIGTRGSLEEDGAGSSPATVAAGLYEVAPGTGQGLLVVPPWNELAIGRPLPAGLRMLDLRTGILWRVVRIGGRTMLRTARWANLARPGVEVLVADGEPDVLPAEAQGESTSLLERRSTLGAGIVGITATRTAAVRIGRAGEARTVLGRIATFDVGPHRLPRPEDVSARHHQARRAGVAALLDEQRRAWSERWRTSDVEVVGDPDLTLAVRLGLFHIAASVADHGEAALGARGLSGTAYAGHVFWDADVFVLPVLAATHPTSARAMLEYRVRRLPQARRTAATTGRAGARFPWESAADGRDVTPTSGVDAHGDVVPILTGAQEEHITADVAWAAWNLASMTGSWRLLDGPARGLVVDTARYWASRVRVDGQGDGHIDHVIGPDEYHEDVDDNAFTNGMAAWNLRRGAELLERTEGDVDRLLAAHEAEAFRVMADRLVTGYDPDTGRHVQFAGYDDLEPLVTAEVGPVPMAADLVLGHQRVVGSQIIKQADVVMLHHLLGGELPKGSLQRDLDFYLPRTAHGSSLSPAVHASVLARAGRVDEAVNMLDVASRIDLEDLTGTTAGGLHLASMGGLWQALVFGFAGVQVARPDDRAFVLDPRLPEHWDELRFSMCWHGHKLKVRCRNDAVHVACARPLTVVLAGGPPMRVTPPGAWLEIGTADGSADESGGHCEAHTRG